MYYCFIPIFTSEETEAQRSDMNFPKPHSNCAGIRTPTQAIRSQNSCSQFQCCFNTYFIFLKDRCSVRKALV